MRARLLSLTASVSWSDPEDFPIEMFNFLRAEGLLPPIFDKLFLGDSTLVEAVPSTLENDIPELFNLLSESLSAERELDSPDFVTDIPEVFIAAGAFEESTDVEMERELFFNLFSFDSEALEDEGELFASFESMEDFDVCFPIVMLELASNFDGSSDGFEAVILLAEAGVVLRPILALPTD